MDYMRQGALKHTIYIFNIQLHRYFSLTSATNWSSLYAKQESCVGSQPTRGLKDDLMTRAVLDFRLWKHCHIPFLSFKAIRCCPSYVTSISVKSCDMTVAIYSLLPDVCWRKDKSGDWAPTEGFEQWKRCWENFKGVMNWETKIHLTFWRSKAMFTLCVFF